MKLIHNSILIPVENEEKQFLIVNTLNGYVGVLSEHEAGRVDEWIRNGEIFEVSIADEELQSQLADRGFVSKSVEDEAQCENRIMEAARKLHLKQSEELKNVVFVLTYRCNFACPYCYEGGNNDINSPVMTREQVDRVFDLYPRGIDAIALFGGEPLLPETRSIIEYILSRAPLAKYEITTNGYYLIDYLPLLKEVNVTMIVVTLDGPESLHNKTRRTKDGGDTFYRIVEGIENSLACGIRVKIRMNISPQNKKSCVDLQRVLVEKYKRYFTMGMLRFELQPLFQLDFEKRSGIYADVLYGLVGDSDKIARMNSMAYTAPSLLKNFVSSELMFTPKYCNCDAETQRRYYDPEGNIYSCVLALKKKKAIIGTYYPQVSYINNSMINRNIETIEKCRTCKLKFVCGGGCANGIIDENGNVMHPNCKDTYHSVYFDLPRLYRMVKEDKKGQKCECK